MEVSRTCGSQPFEKHWLPVTTLLLAVSALYLSFFNAFTVPQGDFFGYHSQAVNYLHMKPIDYFQWLPLFPLLIAVVSLVMPGSQPILLAAEVFNLLLAPMCVWLTYRIARHFFGFRASFCIAALCAVNPAMVYAVAQPILELTLLTTILLTIDLFLRGSRWAYAAGFLASMSRYEAVLLIPALLLHDAGQGNRANRRLSILLGCLASSGIVVWMILSTQHHHLVNPYVEHLMAAPANGTLFLTRSLRLAAAFLPETVFNQKILGALLLSGELALLITGVAALLRQQGRRLLVPLVFCLTYIVIHCLYPTARERYVLSILWMLYLGIGKGIEALSHAIGRAAPRLSSPRFLRRLAWPVRLAAGMGLVYTGFRLVEYDPAQFIPLTLLSMAALLCWASEKTMAGYRLEHGKGSASLMVFSAILALGLMSSSRFMRAEEVRAYAVEVKVVAQWYQRAAKPGDKMLVPFPFAIEYYSQLPRDYVVYSNWLTSTSVDELVEELRHRGVTYVLWDDSVWASQFNAKRFKAPLVSLLREQAARTLQVVLRVPAGSKEAIVYRFQP